MTYIEKKVDYNRLKEDTVRARENTIRLADGVPGIKRIIEGLDHILSNWNSPPPEDAWKELQKIGNQISGYATLTDNDSLKNNAREYKRIGQDLSGLVWVDHY